MSERREPQPIDSEFLPARQAIHELCSEILPRVANETVWTVIWKASVESQMKAADTQERLRASSLGDLMLEDGETLSIDGADSTRKAPDMQEQLRARWLGDPDLMEEDDGASASDEANRMGMPELNLFVGTASLTLAGVKARRLALPGSPAELSEAAGWRDRLSIFIGYENDKHQALQLISAEATSQYPRVGMNRNVTSPSYYGGFDYAGHQPAYRVFTQDKQDEPGEILAFVDLARELIDNPAKG